LRPGLVSQVSSWERVSCGIRADNVQFDIKRPASVTAGTVQTVSTQCHSGVNNDLLKCNSDNFVLQVDINISGNVM
jgi:hypothetical protein